MAKQLVVFATHGHSCRIFNGWYALPGCVRKFIRIGNRGGNPAVNVQVYSRNINPVFILKLLIITPLIIDIQQ